MRSIGVASQRSTPAGLIIRQKEPANLEMPFDQAESYITPTELFYIRSHFPPPKIDLCDYRLRIDGAVKSPLTLSYDELRELTIRGRSEPTGVHGAGTAA